MENFPGEPLFPNILRPIAAFDVFTYFVMVKNECLITRSWNY